MNRLVSGAAVIMVADLLLPGCDRSTAPPTPTSLDATNATASSNAAPLAASASAAASADVARSTPLDPNLAARLADVAVTDASYARRVLWSWTTREQADVLRRDKHLLLDTTLPSGPTPYVELLSATANGAGPNADMARLFLLHPSLRLRRYAWSRPWPTRLGVADHPYGDELLRVVLAPNAIIARFDPGRPDVFAFRDLDGRAVSLGEVLADPSRLAAVLHVRTDPATPIAHREYVLCNESMVSEWSLSTPPVRAAVEEDVALLTGLASAGIPKGSARATWTAARASESANDGGAALFASALAFDTDAYGPSSPALLAVAAAMRRTELSGAPLAVTPTMSFAFDAVVPKVTLRAPPVRVARII